MKRLEEKKENERNYGGQKQSSGIEREKKYISFKKCKLKTKKELKEFTAFSSINIRALVTTSTCCF